ncbi:1,4-dihydroxy-2-naphthoate polyprenyltransferase [Nesterenkonia sp. CL21]|uniref:1,4-dihydroxy-2-naphthoate polyprenyltransferase n=1 Tax=Nesterenkonia sp. CL21 TaxID=3064894 RepID=UPI00287AD0C7|nr:1,4-dihydroxy-2-naphthoate polyprenyltransferase [Nesterenkonia sp. CL21]MDS2172247.1 1,4-dihydroxy-2-naphthoate polyprenyltransferase [Nesterenkonia sp. CL21]
MATTAEWIAGSRPRTLPMAVAPVVIGTAAAAGLGSFDLLIGALAMIVALTLQVGVNYANDYSDGVRGTDDSRVGPMRLTASEAASPGAVKAAAFISFGIAGASGVVIVALSGMWWFLAVGAVCVLAAWWYTGGSRPYGYLGLGEVMVFIFFGLVATLGTTWVMAAQLSPAAWVGAVGAGLIASGLLMANNVRDIPTDRESGKMTLAVRLGERKARISYVLMIGVAVLLPLALVAQNLWFLLVLLVWPLCAGPVRIMLSRRHTGRALITVLQLTGQVSLAFAATMAAAMLLG